jgi:hypothetical protein
VAVAVAMAPVAAHLGHQDDQQQAFKPGQRGRPAV